MTINTSYFMTLSVVCHKKHNLKCFMLDCILMTILSASNGHVVRQFDGCWKITIRP
ncbi:hypothetical protein LHGZ1_2121 [Laribacter hongkongensis]|uniref:Uncharacterized protein n=1 Tax=Laribacter hongkongensis TaxID=168471 RepID=A0A248LJW9_9NEIS|nr:hypothetical protein LHGZ1_2121 [Laribacter hongkongensis]